MKSIADHKLESQMSSENLQRRVAQLEEGNADRRRSTKVSKGNEDKEISAYASKSHNKLFCEAWDINIISC